MIDEINFFGETTFRNENKRFGIKTDDRRRHFYAVGKTGMGKTAMLENMAIQDIREGRGVGFVDPHGEAAERLLDFIPKERVKDVIYFNPSDIGNPIAFNVMEDVDMEKRHIVASGLMDVFKKIWPDVWSARMEYILNNCILSLLEYPGSTLLGINRMLSDAAYRTKILEKVTDPVIKSFWNKEFARYTQRYEVEATAAIQNKIGQFISNPLIRNIIGQETSPINIREAMDKKKILILNLAKGRIGEDNSKLLGALMITRMQLAAMSRVDVPEEQRPDFYLYVDEFQNFATEAFTNILSEARKYHLCLILSHQYIAQMEDVVRDAVFGNMGSIISFRVGAEDAEYLEKEYSPVFYAEDIVNLPKYNIYLKLMIDGVAGAPFSAKTISPFPKPKDSYEKEIIEFCRKNYSNPQAEVDKKILSWTEEGDEDYVQPPAPPILYDSECSICKKPIKVPFKPEPGRPVYCKSCRKKASAKKEDKETSLPEIKKEDKETSLPEIKKEDEGISLSDALRKEPLSFFNPKKSVKKKRKEVDLKELKQTLEESLRENKKIKRGQMKPGEIIEF